MKFSEELNNYMNILDCSAQDLSNSSNLSPTLISRYLNDKRTPRSQSEYINKIANGLYIIANNKNIKLKKEDVLETLIKSLTYENIDYNCFVNNFNSLLLELKINITDLANTIGYDTSFISRIKNEERKPSDLDNFIDKIGQYVFNNYKDKKEILCSLFNCSLEDLTDEINFKDIISTWILSPEKNNKKLIKNFLSKVDSFNLNDYVSTDFSKMKVPTSPVILRTNKFYYGLEGRKKAEAEFLKTTLLSKSNEPIFFYSDLPITAAGKDEEFKKNWVLLISMLLKKGLHLNMVHDVSRPINEMLLGLENWIPLYMTGSISPYYFKEHPSKMFLVTHCTSASVALSGEYLNEKNIKFYITTKKDDLLYLKEKSKFMLSKTKPLMKIFKEENEKEFKELLEKEKTQEPQKIKKEEFKNIDFWTNNNCIIINKLNSPKIHFVVYNEKLKNALKTFLE
ncbi:MAG: helix-turn-helix transcriptional regulator [Clostridia bacterium]|nr:helix-turn-helix transcriptional regulator [Clostridia bacterium]